MRRALMIGLVLLVVAILMAGGAGAQSPSPDPSVTRNLCLTLSGPLIDTVEELTVAIQDGSITIDAFVDGDCIQGPVVVASDEALPVEVVDSGFSFDDGDLHWAAIVRNPNPSGWIANYMAVQVAMLDGNGNLLDSASENVTLLPGQMGAVAGSVSGGKGTKSLEVRISNSEDSWEAIDYEAGSLSIGQVKVARDTYSNEVTGRITSQFGEQEEDVEVVVVYRVNGKIVGGDSTYVDFVPPDGKSSFKVYSDFARLPAGVKAEAYYSLS